MPTQKAVHHHRHAYAFPPTTTPPAPPLPPSLPHPTMMRRQHRWCCQSPRLPRINGGEHPHRTDTADRLDTNSKVQQRPGRRRRRRELVTIPPSPHDPLVDGPPQQGKSRQSLAEQKGVPLPRPRSRRPPLVGYQYEIQGVIAYGGMEWIPHLAATTTSPNAGSSPKGLLNTNREESLEVARAEKEFLAQVTTRHRQHLQLVIDHNP
ncbi:MAG: hypothetical protein U1U88_000958, partial [Lawsonella clevelandensis]